MKTTRRFLAVLLSILTAATAVPRQGIAQVRVVGAASAGTSGVAGGVPHIEMSGTPLTPLSPAIGLLPSLSAPGIPVLPVSALTGAPFAVSAVRPVNAARGPVSVHGQLALVGEKLSAAAAKGSNGDGVLDAAFTGAREFASQPDGSPIAGVPSAPTTLAAWAPEGRATPPTAITLEAMAIDSSKPLPARQAAVARLSQSEGSKESLARVADANPQGGAADYEVHRAALRELAEQGVVRSLRPISLGHKEEILASLALNKPASAAFDYGDTHGPIAAGLKGPMLVVGALTLAVGGLADPRLENAFVWPTKGKEASDEILGALAQAAPVEEMDKKAIGGLFAQRTISIIAFVLTSIAYPLITIPAVGVAGYGALMALGPLAAIATGPLNGLIADRMSARNGLVLMAAMRAVMALALPLFALFGVLNFGTLLLAAVANGWLLSSLMITEGTYILRLAGAKNVPMVNGLAAINYLSIQVILGLILGVGQYVDHFNLMIPFYISAAVHIAFVIPIIWKTIPNIRPAAASAVKAAVSFTAAARAGGEDLKAFLAKYWKEAALFAASVGAYFIWHSALPISGALMLWISRSDGFKAVWTQKPLRWAMLLSALSASLVYPLQYLALPLMALTLGGAAGKGLILGQLLGAYFFGQLVANAGQLSASNGTTKMPDIKIPFTGKVLAFERLVQGVVLGLAAIWAGVSLFPGSLVAAAAAAAIGAALLYGSSKLSARGWIKFYGIGLAAMLLPFAFWGSMLALFASLVLLGMFAGPSAVALTSYFQINAKKSDLGAAIGVNGSTFNAAVSFGYGLMSLIAGLFTPAFPAALGAISLIFIAAGAVFFIAPKLLPGLPESSVNKTPKK